MNHRREKEKVVRWMHQTNPNLLKTRRPPEVLRHMNTSRRRSGNVSKKDALVRENRRHQSVKNQDRHEDGHEVGHEEGDGDEVGDDEGDGDR